MFSIQEFANLSIEKKRLEEQVEYHKEFEKNQAGYIQALKEKIKVLEESNKVQQKLIEKYRDHTLLLRGLIAEEKGNCSSVSHCSNECSCNKPIINKEQFVDIIKSIQDGYVERGKFSDALESVCNGWVVCTLGETWVNSLIDLLCEVMNDTVDKYDNYQWRETILEWWLYEDSEKKLLIKDKDSCKEIEVDLSTPEQLYDYLIENY